MRIIEKLETMVRGARTLVKGAAYTGIALASSLGMTYRANAETIPADYKADTSANILSLADYNSVNTGPNFDNMYGEIKFQDGNQVPAGYILWLLKDSDRAVVGRFATTDNLLEGFFRPYGETGVNNGLVAGNLLDVLFQKTSDNSFYNGDFNAATSYQDKQGAPAIRADITFKDFIIPEPSGLVLIISGALAAGAGAGLGIRRKLKK